MNGRRLRTYLCAAVIAAGVACQQAKPEVKEATTLSPDADIAAAHRHLLVVQRDSVKALQLIENNVLENNGSGAHQVVPHVHFHIIPKPNAQEGLGIGWPAGKLASDGAALAAQMQAAIK